MFHKGVDVFTQHGGVVVTLTANVLFIDCSCFFVLACGVGVVSLRNGQRLLMGVDSGHCLGTGGSCTSNAVTNGWWGCST